MTPFDFLKLVHNKSTKWENFNEDEQKAYNTFIINGILTTLTIKQAIERAGIQQRKGKEYAEGLSVMSQLINKLS